MKEGDKVKIIGPAYEHKTCCDCHRGESFIISNVLPGGLITGTGVPWYPESSLELISKPGEEDLAGINPKDIFESRIVAYCKATNEGNISIHKRLDGIEKQLADLQGYDSTQVDVNSRLWEAIHVLESWQKDHSMICASCGEIKPFQNGSACEPEPIRKGDYVRVMRSWKDDEFPGNPNMNSWGAMDKTTGKVGIAEYHLPENSWRVKFSDVVSWTYPAPVLHKLSPEEICEKLNRGSA
jgi:hypothetical protein